MPAHPRFTILTLTIVLTAALSTGCGKKEQPETPPAEKAAPAATKPTPPQKPHTPPPASGTVTQPTPGTPTSPTKELTFHQNLPPTGKPPRITDPALRAQMLETEYINKPDFSERVRIIYKLSDSGTPEALASLGRIFHMEKDPDLKVEVLDSLFDIDGQDQSKAALLAQGAGPDQDRDVRESAIDGLTDIDPRIALPILQAMVNDPDPEIRELVRDAIEQVQAEMEAETNK
jgi:predicted small lipoprotein YifL